MSNLYNDLWKLEGGHMPLVPPVPMPMMCVISCTHLSYKKPCWLILNSHCKMQINPLSFKKPTHCQQHHVQECLHSCPWPPQVYLLHHCWSTSELYVLDQQLVGYDWMQCVCMDIMYAWEYILERGNQYLTSNSLYLVWVASPTQINVSMSWVSQVW